MNTLYLDPTSWDVALDSSRDIAMASKPYSLAQDAASAIRTFIGECYYDTTQGIDYFGSALGKMPPLQTVKAQLVSAALTVPGIVAAQVFFSSFSARSLSGQVQITDTNGVITAASF